MASSCGIHIDQRRFHVIALEGGARKAKVVAFTRGDIEPGEDPVEVIAAALKRLVKTKKLSSDAVGLAVDSGLAAFRNLTLPFDDRGKIEEVLKYEIESELPQWDIDDVVVDFLVLSSKPGLESQLLVTAVPKERLADPLEACANGGLEATEAELDATALFNAANHAGILAPDSAQVLVHVGSTSTSVVLVDGGRVASMRAIRAGASSHSVAESPPVPSAEPLVGTEGGEDPEAAPLPAAEDPLLAKRLEQSIQRIRRELGRTLSGAQTKQSIDGIYLCGAELPGLLQEELFDVPVRPLDVLPEDSGVPDPREYTVAYGAALGALGAGMIRARLRREGLRFTGKFERIELPFAVFSLLLFTLLAVNLIMLQKQIDWRDEWNPAKNRNGDMQIWLMASNSFMLPNPETGTGDLKEPPDRIVKYAKQAERGEDDVRTKFQEIVHIRQLLDGEIGQLQKELGQVTEIPQPQSALEATTVVLGMFDSLGEQGGRFAIRAIQADYVQGRLGAAGDKVVVKLDVDFLAEDDVVATKHYSNLRSAMESEPWCVEFERKPSKVLDGGGGIYIDGMTIHVDVSKSGDAEVAQ